MMPRGILVLVTVVTVCVVAGLANGTTWKLEVYSAKGGECSPGKACCDKIEDSFTLQSDECTQHTTQATGLAAYFLIVPGQESSPSILVAFDDSDQCDTAEDACTAYLDRECFRCGDLSYKITSSSASTAALSTVMVVAAVAVSTFLF
eukprot:m.61780 g.61780  ORF g.61780 m.61780 type:complete len:148 (+) comp11879_c0_seq3:2211-2654(+)